MFVDKHGHGKGGVLENENKRASLKIRISAGRPQCIKSTAEYPGTKQVINFPGSSLVPHCPLLAFVKAAYKCGHKLCITTNISRNGAKILTSLFCETTRL